MNVLPGNPYALHFRIHISQITYEKPNQLSCLINEKKGRDMMSRPSNSEN